MNTNTCTLCLQLLASLRQRFSGYLGYVTQILSGGNVMPKFSLSQMALCVNTL